MVKDISRSGRRLIHKHINIKFRSYHKLTGMLSPARVRSSLSKKMPSQCPSHHRAWLMPEGDPQLHFLRVGVTKVYALQIRTELLNRI